MIRFLFLALLFPIAVQAVCTSPTGDIGHTTYTSSDMKYCDGTNWNTTTVSLSTTACATPGYINYNSGDMRFCNGSFWVSMKSGVTDSTCTTPVGGMTWRNSLMEYCDGSNWNVMKPSGSYVAIGHTNSPYVSIYNRSDWSKLPNPATLPTGDAKDVSFSPNGNYLAVTYGTSPYLTVYNTSNWSPVTLVSALPGGGTSLAWSANSAYLAVGHNTTPFITIYDTSTWTKIANPSTLPGASATAIAFNPAGTRVLVGWGGTTFFYILDTTTSPWSKIADPATMPGSTVRGAAFSPNGNLAAITVNSPGGPINKMIVYNTSNWSTATSVSTTDTYRGAAFSSDSSKLLIANGTANTLLSYNTSTWAVTTLQASPLSGIAGVRYSQDFTQYGIVSNTTSPYFTVYSTTTDTAYSAPSTLPTGAAGYNAISFYP